MINNLLVYAPMDAGTSNLGKKRISSGKKINANSTVSITT
jgi:hypothetical protein